MKRIILTGLLLHSLTFFAQEQLPEGWDMITIEGKTAYMNLITGETTNVKPTSKAEKPKIAVEVDPSIIHKVKKGETLKIIASNYGISLDSLYSMNTEIEPTLLQINQEIIVGYDKSKEGMIIYKEVEDKYTNPTNNNQHLVKKGETLFSISRQHGVSIKDIKELNGLVGNTLEIGQLLIIK